jgi:nickel-dependent lactate racemase
MAHIPLPYGSRTLTLRAPARNVLAVLTPGDARLAPSPAGEIRRAIEHPIGVPPLREMARGVRRVAGRGAGRVVIAADDLTRQTPAGLIIPALLDELNRAGVADEQVSVLIALGTHRPMTPAEIERHFGPDVTGRVRVANHPWQDPGQLADLGATPNGTPIQASRLALEAGLLIGIGSVAPHHIPGYSGGGKIVQPGLCGPATTGATHYLSTRAPRSYLGQLENPVRAEIDAIAERVGLRAVLNTVLDRAGRLIEAFYGHPRLAHRAAAARARAIYGLPLPARADIVVAGSHPCDLEFWQAHKSLYPAEMAVKEGGTIIVVTPSPEGVTATHGDMLAYTGLEPEPIQALIEDGTIADTVSGALALAWAKVRQRARVCLVSDGISAEEARALGFEPFESAQSALDAAFRRHGDGASLTVLTHAPETLPLLDAA